MTALQPASSPAGTTWVFLLAGQSNMAGRGGIADFPGAEEGQRQEEEEEFPVLRFSARGAWEEVRGSVSHADIDLRKADRCGVGPADSFARTLRRSGLIPDSDRIGFVPCAVGGSSLADWAPDAALPPEDQRYFGPECENFFHAAVQRTRAAVVGRKGISAEGSGSSGDGTANEEASGSSSSSSSSAAAAAVFKGVLWYQGETDAMLGETEAEAETYGQRFTSFVEALQGALAPLSPRGPAVPIPIFTVAVTACSGLPNRRPLPWLPIVRSAQLDVHLDGVSTIDAFGLRLDPSDGLHLTTASQQRLGKRLCDEFVKQEKCCGSFLAPSANVPNGKRTADPEEQHAEWQWAVADARGRVKPNLDRVYATVAGLEHEALLELSGNSGAESTGGGKAYPLFTQRKRKMVNFVYGEIAPASVAALLNFVAPVAGDIFVDLGAGAGKVVLTAALLYPELAVARGVEMMEGYLRDARAATNLLGAAVRQKMVQFSRGDFLDDFESTWSDATIVFACSTCFDEATMEGIARCAGLLRKGTRIVTLDKPCVSDELQVTDVCQMHGSWGRCTAFLHLRM